MSDIIEKLRDRHSAISHDECLVAADELASLRAALAWLNDWLESGRTDEGEAHAMMNSVRAALAGRGPEARGEPKSIACRHGVSWAHSCEQCCPHHNPNNPPPDCERCSGPSPSAKPVPDVRGLLEAVDAVLKAVEDGHGADGLDALAAKRKEWP